MPAFINSYFISLGVLLGGALIGGLSAFFTGQAPMTTVFHISDNLRIWAIVAAIGGTFDMMYTFERGIFDAQTKDIVKQVLLILISTRRSTNGSPHYQMVHPGVYIMRIPPFFNNPSWQRFFAGVIIGAHH